MDEEKNRKQWLQITITCDPQLTESISDYLVGVFSAAVEAGVEDEMHDQTVHAYLQEENPTSESVAGVVSELTAYLKELASIFQTRLPQLQTGIIADEDWGSTWKKYFKPFAIIPGLVIKPSWEFYRPQSGERVLEMDPGMAFGTGHHATTSLCMALASDVLRERAEEETVVLDVGTGTGILAMAAALFGAAEVVGIDNDPDAVAAATDNVAQNGLQHRVRIESGSPEAMQGSYTLVLANIIHDALMAMVDDLHRLTACGGSLVLSGILREQQAEAIRDRYEKKGFLLVERRDMGEWAALHFRKKG